MVACAKPGGPLQPRKKGEGREGGNRRHPLALVWESLSRCKVGCDSQRSLRDGMPTKPRNTGRQEGRSVTRDTWECDPLITEQGVPGRCKVSSC